MMMMIMIMMIEEGIEDFGELYYTYIVNQQMPTVRQNHTNVITRQLNLFQASQSFHLFIISSTQHNCRKCVND
jgi:hypothetical protein